MHINHSELHTSFNMAEWAGLVLVGGRCMQWSFQSQTELQIRWQFPWISREEKHTCALSFRWSTGFHAHMYFKHIAQKVQMGAKSGEGKSKFMSLPSGNPIRDSGVTHQMECLWCTGPFAGDGIRPEALPSIELIGVAALIMVQSRHPWILRSNSSQIRVSKSRPTSVLP